MKRSLLLITFLLFFTFLSAQTNSDNMMFKINRTGLNLQRLKKAVLLIDNAQIRTIYEEAVLAWQKARENYEMKRYNLAQTYLLQAKSKIMQLSHLLSNMPIFHDRYLLKLENTLRKVERKLGDSSNAQARFYLEQAYEFKRQGMQQFKQSDNPLQGVELLAVANKFAERALQLVDHQSTPVADSELMHRINDIESQINEYKNSKTNLNRKNFRQIRMIEALLVQSKQLWNSGKHTDAVNKLKHAERLTTRLIYTQSGQLQAVKLYRQFQMQKQFVHTWSPQEQSVISQKVYLRIQQNLEKIEQAFNAENYKRVRNKLSLNHKLIQTLKGLKNKNRIGIQKNLVRKLAELKQKNHQALEKRIITPGESNLIINWLSRAQKALDSGHFLISSKILTVVNSYLIASADNNFGNVSKEQLQKKLHRINKWVERENNTEMRKLFAGLLSQAQTALDDNRLIKCKKLLHIIEKQIQMNQ